MFGQYRPAVAPYTSQFPWLLVVTVSGVKVTSPLRKLFPAQESMTAGLLSNVSQSASTSLALCRSRKAGNASPVRRLGERGAGRGVRGGWGMRSVHSPFHQFKQVLIPVNYLCEQWELPPQVQSNLFEVC